MLTSSIMLVCFQVRFKEKLSYRNNCSLMSLQEQDGSGRLPLATFTLCMKKGRLFNKMSVCK